jgi:hypothetical protein
VIDLTKLDKTSIEYFPRELLSVLAVEQGLESKYKELFSILHTDDLYDTSKVKPGMRVRAHTGLIGEVTEYHVAEREFGNGGIEVQFEGFVDYFYPNQLTLVY